MVGPQSSRHPEEKKNVFETLAIAFRLCLPDNVEAGRNTARGAASPGRLALFVARQLPEALISSVNARAIGRICRLGNF